MFFFVSKTWVISGSRFQVIPEKFQKNSRYSRSGFFLELGFFTVRDCVSYVCTKNLSILEK